MEVGVKTFDNEDFLRHFENKCDFFEVQAIQDRDYDFLKRFKKSIVIHAEHQGWEVNYSDSKLNKFNLKSNNFARKIADFVEAKKIIVHPGRIANKNCSKKTAFKFIKNLNDKRIIIENHSDFENGLGSTPEKMKELLKETGKGFCFDINHAITSAFQGGKDQFKFIKEFVKLKPKHYHLGGQKLQNFFGLYKRDVGHICLLDSNIDLKKIVKLIPKNAEITLETEVNIPKTEEDLRIMKKLGWKGFDGK